MSARRALLLVDLQNDFVQGGALAVPDGLAVVPVANALLPHFPLVVATQDWHPPDHQSFASQHADRQVGDLFLLDGLAQVAWPDHCVQGTRGADFVPSLELAGVHHVVQKGQDPSVDSYSGFFDNGHRRATGLESFLQAKLVDTVYVMGLATDYCVRFTALDAVRLGFATFLVEDGCRGVELQPGDCQRSLEELREAGVEIVGSADLLSCL